MLANAVQVGFNLARYEPHLVYAFEFGKSFACHNGHLVGCRLGLLEVLCQDEFIFGKNYGKMVELRRLLAYFNLGFFFVEGGLVAKHVGRKQRNKVASVKNELVYTQVAD